MARNRAGHKEGYTLKIAAALNALTYVAGLVSFLSVVRYVGIVFSVAFVCLFVSAFYFDYRRRYPVPRSVLNTALVVFILLNSLRITIDDFATPVVEALLILAAVKFIEEKQTRDYLQIYAISVFLLAGSALLTLDLQFLINLVILAFLLPLCVTLLTFHSQQSNMTLTNRDLSRIVSKALLIPLISIPVTALMFVILPRTGYPILNFLNRGPVSGGFADNVKLGDISAIQESAAVILRVETDKTDERMLYWRGIVLDYFDGTSWRRLEMERAQRSNFRVAGKKVMQTVYLEPYENRYLFALDKPVSVNYKGVSLSGDLTVASARSIDRRIKYSAVSVPSEIIAQESIDKIGYLQLPHRDFGKVKALVKELSHGKSKEQLAMAILHYLREGQFTYSLKNLPLTERPLEDFLFSYKYGNCEYFASAMAVMLRLAGVPSRLVGGYRGGSYNDLGGYYLVTQNNAHVWVEAYFDDKGWVRMDPTPAIGASADRQKGFFFKAQLFLDAINYYWNAMIISYDFNKQISLLISFRNVIRRPPIALPAFKDFAAYAAFVLIGLFIAGAAVYLAVRRKSAEKEIIDAFMKKMKKHGYERSRSEGLRELIEKVEDAQLRDKGNEFVAEFEAIFYRDRKMTRDDAARLRRLLDGM